MIFFITVLRALAACLITNAHYTGIYPTDLIANGGLIGDILFFAVSGYCLYNVKGSFLTWYGKRLYRIYLPVIIMTAIYVVCGAYSLEWHNVGWWFVYPTYYHFVASIIVLYVPFYFIMKTDILRKHLILLMLIIEVGQLLVYLTVYDKSYYHIDTVREPMIRFLFMESMLLGAWFRQNDLKIRNKFKIWYLPALCVMFLIYITSKTIFTQKISVVEFQIFNQYVIFLLLILIFLMFESLDYKLEKMPIWLIHSVKAISSITLEIYVVQYVIIEKIRPIGHFPINWIVLTSTIIISAYILHIVCVIIYTMIDKMMRKTGRKRLN